MPEHTPEWETAPAAAAEIFGDRLPLAQAYHCLLYTSDAADE